MTGITGSNRDEGMDVLGNELITRSEEFYSERACVSVCLIVCDLEILTGRRPRPDAGCSATENVQTIPLQASTGPDGSRRCEAPRFQDNRHTKVVTSSDLRTGSL